MKIIVVDKNMYQIGNTFGLQDGKSYECGQIIAHDDCLYKIKSIKVEYSHYIYLIVKPVKIKNK